MKVPTRVTGLLKELEKSRLTATPLSPPFLVSVGLSASATKAIIFALQNIIS